MDAGVALRALMQFQPPLGEGAGGQAEPDVHGQRHDEVALADLSLSDSEPSLWAPSVADPSVGGAEGIDSSDGATAREGRDLHWAATRAATRCGAVAADLPPFAWLRALPREQRRSVRQCDSPEAARAVLAALLTSQEQGYAPSAPLALLEDLRRHTQAAHRRAVDLEEELAQQAAANEAELKALHEEHERSLRRDKLQLLAQWAPHRAAAVEAVSSEAWPTLLPAGAALAWSPPPAGRSASSGGCAVRGTPKRRGPGGAATPNRWSPNGRCWPSSPRTRSPS